MHSLMLGRVAVERVHSSRQARATAAACWRVCRVAPERAAQDRFAMP